MVRWTGAWWCTARQEGIGAGASAGRLAGLLSLMGDPVRVRLLYALHLVDELCVGDLALALSVSEGAVSYGLKLVTHRGSGADEAGRPGGVLSPGGSLPGAAPRALFAPTTGAEPLGEPAPVERPAAPLACYEGPRMIEER